MSKAGTRPRTRQCAALPVRFVAAMPRVLLVTSRQTRRWIIPKGWLKKKVAPDAMAAREAFEEAGVKGIITPAPIGAYRYVKLLDDGAAVRCHVAVFLLEVTEVLSQWPEMDQRERRWLSPADAAEMISDGDLIPLLRGVAEGMPGQATPNRD